MSKAAPMFSRCKFLKLHTYLPPEIVDMAFKGSFLFVFILLPQNLLRHSVVCRFFVAFKKLHRFDYVQKGTIDRFCQNTEYNLRI